MIYSRTTFMCGVKQASESEMKVDFYKTFKHCGFAACLTLSFCSNNLELYLKQMMQCKMNKLMTATVTVDSSQDIRLTHWITGLQST